MQTLLKFYLLTITVVSTSFSAWATPDLTITEFMRSPIAGVGGGITTPTPIQAGGTVLVTGSMKNIGNGTSISTKIRFYLSTDVAYSADDSQLGEMNGTPLATNASQFIVEQSLTIPASIAPGNYYILCYADATNSLLEANENNNIVGFPLNITKAADKPTHTLIAPNITPKNNSLFEGLNFGK